MQVVTVSRLGQMNQNENAFYQDLFNTSENQRKDMIPISVWFHIMIYI